MVNSPRNILLCTLGTSLKGNLKKQRDDAPRDSDSDALLQAFLGNDWRAVGQALATIPSTERICGAEINSIGSMIELGYVPADVGLFFFHSATPDGKQIAEALVRMHELRGHAPVQAIEVPDLQDSDPKRFRTHGLRNLARLICRVIRDFGDDHCAINATGGYKAQIAIGVLLGQAIGVPVYYKHELFSEIIAFPPLPIALDFETWMRASGLLRALEEEIDPIPASEFDSEWEERFEALVERELIDGVEYLALSAAGQIFGDTFRERFRTDRDQVLPPPASPSQKQKPLLKSEEAHMLQHRTQVECFLQRLTTDVPQVLRCTTRYFNPDLPQRIRFIETRGEIEGILSNGSYCIKFRVDSTAKTSGQRAAVVAALNDWLRSPSGKF